VKIPIQNVYYLLCFAWKYAPQELAFDVGSIPASSDILDLCSHVLISGMDYLFRRGLDRGYLLHVEETSVLKGRIDFTATIRRKRHATTRAVCQFDDLNPNVLHNQIIRSCVWTLMGTNRVSPELRESLSATFAKLSGVDTIRVNTGDFRRVQLHRNNRYYGFVLFICRLVYSLKLPDHEGEGSNQFNDLLSDEAVMADVFEEFLRSFYLQKQNEFKDVGITYLKWNATAKSEEDLKLLPRMETDITMRSGDRTIIIDAKYYKNALQEYQGAAKAHSENVYQLLAYLRAESSRNSAINPEGMLIYPVAENAFSASFTIDGYPIRLFTLNLNQHWEKIENDLLWLIAPERKAETTASEIIGRQSPERFPRFSVH
jgi:5-methylcytosine-specific restriction enzyme subunit McrC